MIVHFRATSSAARSHPRSPISSMPDDPHHRHRLRRQERERRYGGIRAHRARPGRTGGPREPRHRGVGPVQRGRPDGRGCQASSRTRPRLCSCGRTSGQEMWPRRCVTPEACSSTSRDSRTTSSRRPATSRSRTPIERGIETCSDAEAQGSCVPRRRPPSSRERRVRFAAARTRSTPRRIRPRTTSRWLRSRRLRHRPRRRPRARLHRRARAARAAEEPGHPHRGGVPGEEEADPRDLTRRRSGGRPLGRPPVVPPGEGVTVSDNVVRTSLPIPTVRTRASCRSTRRTPRRHFRRSSRCVPPAGAPNDPLRADRRRRLCRLQRVRRAVPNPGRGAPRGERSQVQPLPHDGALLAHAPGAAHRPQPPHGGHGRRSPRSPRRRPATTRSGRTRRRRWRRR